MADIADIYEHLEQTVNLILDAFDIDEPPVPVELMLRRPREGLWPEVDLAELSASFLDLSDRYSPRMSVVRLLSRHIARCPWGQEHQLQQLLTDKDLVNRFARAIIMPRELLLNAMKDKPALAAIGSRFEVPEVDLEQRLTDLGIQS
jgi:hypothetical protein